MRDIWDSEGEWLAVGIRRQARLVALVAAAALVASACTGAPRPDDSTVAAGGSTDHLGFSADDRAELEQGADVDGDGVADGDGPGGIEGANQRAAQKAGAAGGGAGAAPGAPGTPGAPLSPGFTPLFSGAEDRIGITDTSITMCAHAALTYGAAFNTSADDLNVYWTAVNEELGGVYGRKVSVSYENDNYDPKTAITAAEACKEKGIFLLLGGIGFDQIPAVRNWAETNRMPYFHHTATVNGSAGKKFSYTGLPTTEKMGAMFAEAIATQNPGAKVAIIKRASENWEPGIDGFKAVAAQRDVNIVFERQVQVNKRTYGQDIIDARNSNADLVFVWLNALESTEFITQTRQQGWAPQFWVFPFNLTAQTLGDLNRSYALEPPVRGVAMFNAFSKGDYGGEFAKYADDMKQFEAQYAKYRPNVDLGGVGGDLLFLNWSAQKAAHQLLLRCGQTCTRNGFLAAMHGFKGATNSSACPLDFTRPGPDNSHRGGWQVSVMETYASPSGKVNFRNTHTCVEHL